MQEEQERHEMQLGRDKERKDKGEARQGTKMQEEQRQGFGKHCHSVRASASKRLTAIYHLKIFNTAYDPMSWEGGQYLLKE